MSGSPPSGHAAAAEFADAVFISYAHLDNQPFGPDQQHWISHLHEHLSNRVQQLIGAPVSVWRDDKLQGNDIFPSELEDRLSSVAVLVTVCSPRYLNSEWCLRELDAFIRAAELTYGVEIGTRSRLFKVLKTPVPPENLPEPLVPLLGYEFYEVLPRTNHVREYLLNPDPDQRWKFYARVDDLAQDIVGLLGELSTDRSAMVGMTNDAPTVYLGVATSDVAAYRDQIRRDLERRGHIVLPRSTPPLTVEALTAAVEDDLSRSQVSIHLLGAPYGARPEGDDRSISHIQLDLAGRRADSDGLIQLIWLPDDVESPVGRQAALVDGLLVANIGAGVEIIRSSLEPFMAYALDRLSPPLPAVEARPPTGTRVYLVHDRGDREAARAVQAWLESQGCAVMVPLSEGSATEMREVHETSMVVSDAVLIYYGNATEHWLRMKLFDVVKAPGWGRNGPFRATGVCVAPPATQHKATYATNEAMVLDATGGFDPSILEEFLVRLARAAS